MSVFEMIHLKLNDLIQQIDLQHQIHRNDNDPLQYQGALYQMIPQDYYSQAHCYTQSLQEFAAIQADLSHQKALDLSESCFLMEYYGSD